jgi:hypothetical protein
MWQVSQYEQLSRSVHRGGGGLAECSNSGCPSPPPVHTLSHSLRVPVVVQPLAACSDQQRNDFCEICDHWGS